MFGFLNIDKPSGLTSRRAVDAVKKRVRPAKVGHTGTLDPLASGVLLIAVGPATRLSQFVLEQSKTYVATYRLGVTSTTNDLEGEVLPVPEPPIVSGEQLSRVLPEFSGEIDQVPPEFSAVKVDGRRAYRLARRGHSVQLASRKVTIHRLKLLHFEYPEFRLLVECSSGTYLRSLGRDIGQRLGSGAVMTELVRTRVATEPVESAVALSDLEQFDLPSGLIPPQNVLPHIPRQTLGDAAIAKLQNGLLLSSRELGLVAANDAPPAERLLALDPADRLMAVLVRHAQGVYRPAVNFAGHWRSATAS